MTTQSDMRIDKWLWHARFFRSRSLATQFCNMGRLRVNGAIINKAHFLARPDMVLTFSRGRQVQIIKIIALSTRRGPATEAQTLYQDLSPALYSRPTEAKTAIAGRRTLGSGRPTKRERRKLDQFLKN